MMKSGRILTFSTREGCNDKRIEVISVVVFDMVLFIRQGEMPWIDLHVQGKERCRGFICKC